MEVVIPGQITKATSQGLSGLRAICLPKIRTGAAWVRKSKWSTPQGFVSDMADMAGCGLTFPYGVCFLVAEGAMYVRRIWAGSYFLCFSLEAKAM